MNERISQAIVRAAARVPARRWEFEVDNMGAVAAQTIRDSASAGRRVILRTANGGEFRVRSAKRQGNTTMVRGENSITWRRVPQGCRLIITEET